MGVPSLSLRPSVRRRLPPSSAFRPWNPGSSLCPHISAGPDRVTEGISCGVAHLLRSHGGAVCHLGGPWCPERGSGRGRTTGLRLGGAPLPAMCGAGPRLCSRNVTWVWVTQAVLSRRPLPSLRLFPPPGGVGDQVLSNRAAVNLGMRLGSRFMTCTVLFTVTYARGDLRLSRLLWQLAATGRDSTGVPPRAPHPPEQ